MPRCHISTPTVKVPASAWGDTQGPSPYMLPLLPHSVYESSSTSESVRHQVQEAAAPSSTDSTTGTTLAHQDSSSDRRAERTSSVSR